MSCEFCNTYHESSDRYADGRFCFHVRAVVNKHREACENFDLSTNFWCPKTDCWLSVPMCQNRQSKPEIYPECPKCSKGREVVEIRRFAGILERKKNQILANGISEVTSHQEPKKKSILIRRTA